MTKFKQIEPRVFVAEKQKDGAAVTPLEKALSAVGVTGAALSISEFHAWRKEQLANLPRAKAEHAALKECRRVLNLIREVRGGLHKTTITSGQLDAQIKKVLDASE